MSILTQTNAGFIAIVVVALAGLGTAGTLMNTNTTAQTVTDQTTVEGSFASITTIQDAEHIVITVTKQGANEPPPDGPIIIIPDPENPGNGTIVVPDENATEGQPGNVTIIDPIGNITEIPDGNVTIIDNDTVVVTPPDENVTQTPGNVTVIDPEPPSPPTPEECGCPIPPVNVTPAPGQNVTVGGDNQTTTEEPAPAPADNQTTTEEPAPPAENQTSTSEEPAPAPPVENQTVVEQEPGNATINAPESNITITDEPPAAEVTPSSSTLFGSFRIPMT